LADKIRSIAFWADGIAFKRVIFKFHKNLHILLSAFRFIYLKQKSRSTIIRYGKDKETGKPYDEANTFNILAQFRANIMEMLEKFREVSAATEKAAAEMNKAEVKVFETG
jgi:hypothetical protein